MMKELRHYFISGIATLLPVSFTIIVFWFIVTRMGSILSPLLAGHPLLRHLPSGVVLIIGFILVLIGIVAVGAAAEGIVGHLALTWIDRLLRRMPIVKAVYGSARQLTNAVFVERSSLRKTVIAEYPRHGLYAIGFLTSDDRVDLPDGRKALFVFFPTAPNPTSGWLALIPEADVADTSMSIEDGLKLVVSGGVIRPPDVAASLRYTSRTTN